MYDITELAEFAKELALISRQIILKSIESGVEFEIKNDGSPVTPADKEVECALRQRIAESYPGFGILGEEYENHNLDAEYVWIIDPIDGTKHYAVGVPLYCTLIGLAHHGEFVFGLMDFPVTDDQWIGGHGMPAQHNGKSVNIRDCENLSKACFSACDPLRESTHEQEGILKLAGKCCFGVWGASSYGFGMVTSGKMDLAIECGLDPFDFAAPTAILEAAGGKVTDWQGNPVNINSTNRLLFAGDARLIDEAVEVLSSH